MSLNFTTDNSVQLTYTSFPFTTPPLDGYTTSNYVSNISNLLINNINTKQATLTAATNLLGVGTAITAIDYNKITVNKPSTFPADMTNIYSKTETNNLLSAKEANLTFSSPLTRTTNTIGINLSSYSTTGNDASYLLKTGGTMTGAIVNTSATASDFKGIYIMHAARQSHLPYIPDGKFYLRAPLVIDNPADFLSFGARTGDFIIKLYGEDYGFGVNGYTLRYNASVGASHKFYTGSTNTFTINEVGNISTLGTITEAGTLLTSKYLQLSGGNMAANANITLSGTGTFTGIHSGNGAALTNLPLSAYSTTGNDASYLLKTGGTLTGTLNGPTINATTALQEGGTNLTSKYLQLSGGNMATNANITLSGTGTFTGIHSGNGAALTNLPLSAYSTTGNDASYVLKTGSTMTGLLSATTINTTGNIGIGITNPPAPLSIGTPDILGSDGFICIGKYKASVGNRCFKIGYDDGFNMCFGDFGATLSATSWTPNQFNINWNSGNVGIGTSGQSQKLNVNGTTYFNGASTVNGTLTATTFSGSGASLTNLPLSAYSTTGNDASYVLKTGSTMTGNLTVNADLILKNSVWHRSIDGVYRFYYGLNDVSYYCCGGALAEGHIFMNSGYTHIFKIKNNADVVSTGKIGIGTETIDERIHIYTSGTNNAFIKADAGGGTGQAGLRLFAGSNTSNRATRIDFFNNVASTTSARWSILNDTDQNGTNDFRIYNAGSITNVLTILQSGNIGIGTAVSASFKLSVGGGINAAGSFNSFFGGLRLNGFDTGNTIWQDTGNLGISANTGNNIIFNIGNGGERMRINSSGTVNIVNTLQIASVDINNWLFNNTGRNHGVYQDFNAIDKFGYTFIQNSTNGPGTGANQFYSWYIGLGNEYPFANSVNGYYGMQFAIGRSETYPKLSVRRKENNAWTGWEGLTAERAVSLTSGDKTISGTLTTTGRTYCNGGLNIQVNSWVYDGNGAQRIYFGSGAKTYYQGYGQYTTDINHEWWNHSSTPIMKLSNTGSLVLEGEIIPLMASVANSGTDYCGVTLNSSQGTNYKTSIKIMFGTFTGFHRCFTDDIEFKEEEPQKFKDDYIGRIVISTGKIATDTKIENEEEWTIKYDKEGITIEDALPIIQLSRTKKDKRVFGVLGMPSRNNSRVERMIVNSVGEGGIWICNSNGNIENGDYITSSDYLGYGEKQDDDLLHNYTVAKATIECNFELDSPLYECQELEGGLRVAFIACTYHCG
jgi:hypothetical protein